jgi:hypothetical protein
MARVFLLSAAPPEQRNDYNVAAFRTLLASAKADSFGKHVLTDDAEAAEIILFAELLGTGLHFEVVRRHPLVKRYREKCFLFCSNAYVIPFLPGVFASVGKRWASRRTQGGFHVGSLQNEFSSFTPMTAGLPYLFSFIGSTASAPVRRQLGAVIHPRGFFRDTVKEFERALHDRMTLHERRDYHRQFVELTKASKFVLCPRGLGPATIRLMETMRMGRVPVIISDDWVEPNGPNWQGFSIRVPERAIADIPRLLEAREAEALAMGNLAREEWQRWFSDEVAFHRVVEWCLQIRDRRRLPESIARLPVYLQLLRPFHLKWALRSLLRKARGQVVG